jgi:uncharacterized protein YecT (DUF1311 family)
MEDKLLGLEAIVSMRKLQTSAILLTIFWASSAAAELKSCIDTAGQKMAGELSSRCFAVSSTSTPPCHPGNSCDMIIGEVRRGCLLMNAGVEPVAATSAVLADPTTAFCREYLDVSGEVLPSFDCAKPATSTEATICASSELTDLDNRLANAYSRATLVGAISAADQRQWLTQRDKSCARDVTCLRDIITRRRIELQALEVGTVLSPGAQPIKNYADITGKWRVIAVTVYGTGVVSISDDDVEYMGAEIEFKPDGIAWFKGTAYSPLSDFENCNAIPTLQDKPLVADDRYYQIPQAKYFSCGGKGWGPGSSWNGTAQVRRLAGGTLQLYWYDSAVLALKPVE